MSRFNPKSAIRNRAGPPVLAQCRFAAYSCGLVETAPPQPERPGRSHGLRRFRARWFALFAIVLIALYLCWLMLQPFIEVLLWAIVLVIVFYPMHRRLLAKLKRPSLAAILSVLVVMLVILAPLALVTIAVVNEATDLVRDLEQGPGRFLDPGHPALRWLGRYVDVEQLISKRNLADVISQAVGWITARTFVIASEGLIILLKVIVALLTMYYLFRDAERIRAAMIKSLPLERTQTLRIFERTREVIGASVYGVLVIATIQAALAGPMFWALGIQAALLWTVVMFLLAMIPVGSFLVWVPAALWLGLSGYWGKALVLSIWCVAVVSMADYLLRPRLVGRRTRMHELLVLLSVLGGLQVFGPLGLVVGPVVVSITLALVDVFRTADRPPTAPPPVTLAERQAALRDVPPEDQGGGERSDDDTERDGVSRAGMTAAPES